MLPALMIFYDRLTKLKTVNPRISVGGVEYIRTYCSPNCSPPSRLRPWAPRSAPPHRSVKPLLRLWTCCSLAFRR
jgi:hypothetical protein